MKATAILKYPGGKQHVELLELILKSKSKICISAYDNELYNEYLKGWYTDEKKTTAQMGKQRVEKLYMNYQPDLLALAQNNGVKTNER